MKGYSNLLKGELFKVIKSRGILIILAISVILIVLVSLVFSLAVSQINEFIPGETEQTDPAEYLEEVDAYIEVLDIKYQNNEIFTYRYKLEMYQLRSLRSSLVYMIDNGLSYQDYTVFMGGDMILSATREKMMMFSMSAAMTIIGIIATVLAASAINSEVSNGTMRMLLINPVNRIKLIMAKLAVIKIELVIVTLTMMLTAYLMSLLLDSGGEIKIMMIINAEKVILVPLFVAMLIQFGISIIYGMFMAVAVLAIAIIFKNKVFAIILGVIAASVTLPYINSPKLLNILRCLPFTNMNFTGFLNLNGNFPGQLDLPLAIIVYIIYIVVFLGLSSLIFARRDIN